MDPNVANQFITLKDLQSFPGQMLAVGAIAEITKRLWIEMPDSLNRLFILCGAICVNFIVSLSHQGLPLGGLAWSSLLLVTLINAFVIALTTMKSIEFIAERKVGEISRDLAASGVQVQTTVSPDKKPLAPDKIEAAPLAPLATTEKDAPVKGDVTPKRLDVPEKKSP